MQINLIKRAHIRRTKSARTKASPPIRSRLRRRLPSLENPTYPLKSHPQHSEGTLINCIARHEEVNPNNDIIPAR